MSEPHVSRTTSSNLALVEAVATSNKRQSKRIVFYKGEFPDATIEFNGRRHEADVYDLSTSGVALLPRGEITGLDSLSQKVTIRLGPSAPRQATLVNIAHIKFSGSLRLKLGFNLDEVPGATAPSAERFACGNSMPLAYCDDPIAFDRTILFNVAYFTQAGLVLRTNIEDGVLYSGLRLDLRLMMPARGEFKVVAEILSVSHEDQATEIYCQFTNPTDALRSSIAEFLLMSHPGLTIKDLSGKGFLTTDLTKAFVFRCTRNPSEFDQVLQLRLKAAQKDGRWVGETDIEKMRDPWDKYARHIYCEINGKVVAAARLVFNNGLPSRSEHVSYQVDVPQWLWETGFVECSRVCTDPDFRGADLFFHIIQHLTRVVTQAGYRYVLINCVDSLVPIYKKAVGVFSLNHRFHTPFMQDRALNLLCVDVRAVQVGINLMPSTWVLNAPVGSYLIQTGKLKLRWWEKILRFAFTRVHQLAVAAYRRQRRTKVAKG